jgi:hypothetical protein
MSLGLERIMETPAKYQGVHRLEFEPRGCGPAEGSWAPRETRLREMRCRNRRWSKTRCNRKTANFRRHTFIPLLVVLLIGAWFAPASRAQQDGPDPTTAPATDISKKPVPFTIKDRINYYRRTTFAPLAAIGPIAGASVRQWITGTPPQWGPSAAGYGRRLLSGYSRQVIANSVGLGVAFAADEDPRRRPTGEQGLWKRGVFAARGAFVSHNRSGGLMPAYSRIIGAYAAGFTSNAWYPAPYSNFHSSLYRGSTALASDIVWQEFREFWPDVHHKLFGHH